MPELPEVECVRRVLARLLAGHYLDEVVAPQDEIVFAGRQLVEVQNHLRGAEVAAVGRKGKFFWLELAGRPSLIGHLGMNGWLWDLSTPLQSRLVSHGKAPVFDEQGVPRFLKLLLASNGGGRVAFTDGRRLARFRPAVSPLHDPGVAKLGRDTLEEPFSGAELQQRLGQRSAPLKALMLDQALFCGVGNWVADEALYQSGIAPFRPAKTLALNEWIRLADALISVLRQAVEVNAESDRFPGDWLFHVRWGGSRGADQTADGARVERLTVGGRTTAWVPSRQG